MARYMVARMRDDGTQEPVGGIHYTQESAERAVNDIRRATRNSWAVNVTRVDTSFRR